MDSKSFYLNNFAYGGGGRNTRWLGLTYKIPEGCRKAKTTNLRYKEKSEQGTIKLNKKVTLEASSQLTVAMTA